MNQSIGNLELVPEDLYDLENDFDISEYNPTYIEDDGQEEFLEQTLE